MAHTVVAELVANVLKVTAQAGDEVGPEDTLVILESMKMEIPVLAEVDPRAGRGRRHDHRDEGRRG